MKLLNFIKRKFSKDYLLKQTIKELGDCVPEFYNEHKQYVNYIEFLKNREWALAIDSLIELANETQHSFSEDFWLGLVNSSQEIGLIDQANYCKSKIARK